VPITLGLFGEITPFICQYFREYWATRTSLYKRHPSPPAHQRWWMRRMAFHTHSTHKQSTPNWSPVLLSGHCLLKKGAKSQKAPWRG